MARNEPKTNVYWIVGRVALLDVSTKTHPRTVAMVGVADLLIALDGRGRWRANHIRGTTYCSRAAAPRLHKLIMPGDGMIDHADSDGLNNLRRNLRRATRAENAINSRKQKNTASGFKGVHLEAGKWRTRIQVNGRLLHLGLFRDAAKAARVYDAAARRYFGEFAKPNFKENAA